MIKTIYNNWCETMVQGKLFMTIRSSFFALKGYQIVTLTCEHRYLRLLMLNNGTNKTIMTIISSFFIMRNYTMITSFQTTLQLQQWSQIKLHQKWKFHKLCILEMYLKFLVTLKRTCTKIISLENILMKSYSKRGLIPKKWKLFLLHTRW